MAGPSIPRATYRVQLHRGFTFQDARAIVPYLAALGISHLYTSPFLQARAGSAHGYDVVDHDALNREIGSESDLAALVAELHAHGMSLMLDLVPNHMGVLKADNRWWLDVLEHGRASSYADHFDIDWDPEGEDLQGKVLVPILGDQYGTVLERGELALRFDAGQGELSLWYFEHRLPIRPALYPQILLASVDGLQEESGIAIADALRRVASAFAAVPTHPLSASTAADIPDAETAGARAKAALAMLCAHAPAVTRWIAQSVRTINGVAGEPASFDALDALIAGQAHRLAFWRAAADDINYRRFFDINDLAALRADLPAVFVATHRRALDLVRRHDADALRIDHPDGLADPQRYFATLQAAVAQVLGGAGTVDARGRATYVVIEKILAPHERLPESWPVHGTTGYAFMNRVNGLFVDPAARTRFDRLYAAFIGEHLDFGDVLRRSRTLIAAYALAGDLNRLTHALTRIAKSDRHTCDFTRNALRRALVETVASFPVYRTYATEDGASQADRAAIDTAFAAAKRANTADETGALDFVAAVLRGDLRCTEPGAAAAVRRFVEAFQQFTAPVMAKGMEDTAFYIFNRLASLNEVGGDPRVFGSTTQEFHRATASDAKAWPHALLATSTHDSKRGEDVRARLDVLSEMPAAWRLALRRWRQMNRDLRTSVGGAPAPSRNDEYLLYQAVVGAWPLEPLTRELLDGFRERIQAYMQKAVREAKVHTSWVNRDTAYEDALSRFVDALLRPDDNPFVPDVELLLERIAPAACVNGLAQTLVKFTAPGVPDVYQGTESWDLSLVDPDNRRPVDYPRRERVLRELAEAEEGPGQAARLLGGWRDGRVKLWLIAKLLALKRRRGAWFDAAGYSPLRVHGAHAAHICAYARGGGDAQVVVIVPRLWTRLAGAAPWPVGAAVWGDTHVALPGRRSAWRNVLTAEKPAPRAGKRGGTLDVGTALATFPLGLLESV